MVETYLNFIDGEWVESESGETFEDRNPADTDDLIGEFQRSTAEDAARAVEAAAEAADEWANTPAPQRGAILRETGKLIEERYDDLTETLTREEGKTLAEAGEVGRAYDIFYYYAEKTRDFRGTVKTSSTGRRNVYTVQEPVGVASLITPWNYPAAIPAWKLAPALAAGNSVVFKPATHAPNVARKLVECLEDAGIPDGVLNFVTGPGSQVGDTFTTHELVDAVSFTGSAEVGMNVYRAAADEKKRVQTEMGGKNPTIVAPSADLDEAVDIVGAGAFGVTGQACTACSRAIVHDTLYDDFVAGIVDYAEGLTVGPGLEADTDMGPHVSESELEGTLDYIDVAQREGATLATGGERLTEGEYANGYFVEPTVFSDVEPDMRIAQEEVFGPVLAVIPYSDLDQGIHVANDVDYGLSASIVTDDHTEANRFLAESESGVAKVNEKTTGLELHVPFGGYKRSSSETWREQGDAGLEFYTLSKTVYDNY